LGNTPFRYYKQYGHEGGCNTHFIACWPKVIKPGIITDQPGHVVDIVPTLLEITKYEYPEEYDGMKLKPLDGSSLFPIFNGKKRLEPEYFVSGLDKFRMYKRGKWKIVKVNDEDWQLYDMENDKTELNNSAGIYSEKVKELSELYKKWYLEHDMIGKDSWSYGKGRWWLRKQENN